MPPTDAKNPFVGGCTAPFATARRLACAALAAVLGYCIIFALEKEFTHQRHPRVVWITSIVGALAVGLLTFKALGSVRDKCDSRDLYDFYLAQGAKPNVAAMLTYGFQDNQSMVFLVMLGWIYLCAR